MLEVKVKKKQRNLLLKSEVTKDYPWLSELLVANESFGVERVPQELKDEFASIVPFIIKQGSEEWKGNEDVLFPVEDMGEVARKRCGLCGTKNRYIHYIKNRLNGNTLNVGKDCVEEFADIDFLQHGKSKAELYKNARKIRRMAEINKKINGIDLIIESWNRIPNRYDIIIPNSIEKPFIECGVLAKKYYEGYLDEKYSESIFKKVEDQVKLYYSFIQQMDDYQINNIKDKFVVTRAMMRWLADKGFNEAIAKVKDEGKISPSTIQQMYEPTFIKGINKNIVKVLEKLEIEVTRTDYENGYYVIKPDIYNGQIILHCKFDKVVFFFGGLLFNEKPYANLDMKNLIRVSTIADDKSIENLIDVLSHNKFSRMQVSLHYDSFELNEVDITNIVTGEVMVTKLNDFVNQSKRFMLHAPESELQKFEEHLLSMDLKKYTKEELRQAREEIGSISSRFGSLKDDD
ncbi:hypothetical protein [Paenibacillus sp. FSL H3-0333]|uniref:hypothetical protein n=1 Tax=Paenibacillus sp. FSL H3-0333 TaxID=2921373 RepID=UPI0030FCD13E